MRLAAVSGGLAEYSISPQSCSNAVAVAPAMLTLLVLVSSSLESVSSNAELSWVARFILSCTQRLERQVSEGGTQLSSWSPAAAVIAPSSV
jgi:hypothetical protein